jgi:hypothetical protein
VGRSASALISTCEVQWKQRARRQVLNPLALGIRNRGTYRARGGGAREARRRRSQAPDPLTFSRHFKETFSKRNTMFRILPPQPTSPVSADILGPAVEIRAEWGHLLDVARSPRLGIGLSDASLAVCLQGAIFGISFWRSALGGVPWPAIVAIPPDVGAQARRHLWPSSPPSLPSHSAVFRPFCEISPRVQRRVGTLPVRQTLYSIVPTLDIGPGCICCCRREAAPADHRD